MDVGGNGETFTNAFKRDCHRWICRQLLLVTLLSVMYSCAEFHVSPTSCFRADSRFGVDGVAAALCSPHKTFFCTL